MAAVETGDAQAAIALLCSIGLCDPELRELHPLVVCSMALAAWTEVLKTWDDPWTWPPRSYLYPLRHPLQWLYQRLRLIRWLWDRRIWERLQHSSSRGEG